MEENIKFDEIEIIGSGQAQEWMIIAESLTVTDEDSESEATDILKKLGDCEKKIEAQRKDITVPINNELGKINAVFKTLSTPLSTAKINVKNLILGFRAKRAQETLEAIQEKERKDMEALKAHQKELAEAEKQGEEPPPPPQATERPHIPDMPNVVKGDHGGAVHSRPNWKFEIITPSKVPARFTRPDEKLIKDFVKMGGRDIPGVRIYNEPILVSR